MAKQDNPIAPEFRQKMRAVAVALDRGFNPKFAEGERDVGFVLLLFEFSSMSATGCNYISNAASRQEVAQMMREMADKMDKS